MGAEVRVRFAPSPTGPLHIGGVRTALYNYLFAKGGGGRFILRIEDTDSQRFVPGAEEYIIEALSWCGILPDEGVEGGKVVESPSSKHPYAPYRQSLRGDIYSRYAQQLVEAGSAYYAFDSAEELEKLRKEAQERGEGFLYNYQNRESLSNSLSMPKNEVERRLKESRDWVIRFKVSPNRKVELYDLIRGEILIDSNTIDDKVIWKSSDSLPTYHLANVVDDVEMKITHVIRGEEWLPSLALHYLLYEALGWEEFRPQFAHLPLLLKPDGKGKLSKRDGERLGFPVFPLEWREGDKEVSRGFREDGYYPEAFINNLALLGWNPGGENELFTLQELVESFSIDRIVHSGAKFNVDKAKWFNQEYLRKRDIGALALELSPILKENGVDIELSKVEEAIALVGDRIAFVDQIWKESDYLFKAPSQLDPKLKSKVWNDNSSRQLKELSNIISQIENFTPPNIEEEIKNYIKENSLPMGQVMNTIRLMLVGEGKGISVAQIIYFLGKEESLSRLSKSL
ncbi:MAG: glutamate--tRNA ligase [Bacteroidales bacterium]